MTDEPERILQRIEAWKCPKCGILHSTLLEAEKCAKSHEWPKKTKLYLHGGSDSDMWGKGEKLGLSEEACENEFRGALYEVTFEVSVNEDGTYDIIRVYQNNGEDPYVRAKPLIELVNIALMEGGIEGSRQWYGAEEIGKLNDEIDRLKEVLQDLQHILTNYEVIE